MATDPADALARAADPNIEQRQLFEIARSNPQAYSIIASNPQAYPDLLQWLRQVGDDFTKEVLNQREAGLIGREAYEAARAKFIAGGEAQSEQADGASDQSGLDDGAADQRDEDDPDATVALAAGAATTAAGVGGAADSAATQALSADPEATQALSADPEATQALSADPEATQALPAQDIGSPAQAVAAAAPAARTSILGTQQAGPATPTYGTVEQPPMVAPTTPQYSAQPAPQVQYQAQPQQAYAQPAAGVPAAVPVANQQQKGSGSKAMVILLVVLAVIAIALAGTVAYFLTRKADPTATATIQSSQKSSSSDSRANSDDSDSQVNEGDDSQPRESLNTPDNEVKLPAPAGALHMTSFVMPSHNIACAISGDQAVCTIGANNTGQCGGNMLTATITKSGTRISCGENANWVEDGEGILNYGSATASGDFACTSDKSGVDCWDIKTRHGLHLSRDLIDTTDK